MPESEPVSLAELKDWVGIADVNSDAMLSSLIAAARDYAEGFCGRSFCQKGYIQALDSYPYYIDTISSQNAYPPSYYTAPRFSTTMWNYSQMIKLAYGPLLDVSILRYVASSDGTWNTLVGTTDMSNNTADFLGDVLSLPPRLFPKAGNFWPAVLYVPNSVEIHYTSGEGGPSPAAPTLTQAAGGALNARTYYLRLAYTLGATPRAASQRAHLAVDASKLITVTSPAANELADGYNVYAATASGQETLQNSSPIAIGTDWTEGDSGLTASGSEPPSDASFVPDSIKTAIKLLAAGWFENRESSSPLQMRSIPQGVEALLWMNKIWDESPTRG